MKKALALFLVGILLSTSAFAQGAGTGTWTRLKGDYMMAVSRKAYEQANSYIFAGDTQAWLRMQEAELVGMSKEGLEVYVVNLHPFGGNAEVRPRGTTHVFWVNKEAIGWK
ncbi:hypothetical protein ACFL1I_08215 [Candidatus Omnitrophota bacterium]